MVAKYRLRVILGAAILGLAACVFGAGAAADDTVARHRLALLIGVGRYEQLPASQQLDGSTNDVAAMRRVLIDRYGFAASDIVTLSDGAATAEGMRREFRLLAAKVNAAPRGKAVEVVVHFSGHGSQVADQNEGDPDCDELDGLDETLVPYDAEVQGGTRDIRDDELNALADEVCRREGTQLLIVLDCCHSGSGARGLTKIRRLSRGLEPLGEAEQAKRRVATKKLPSRAVVLSACRADEVEPEYQEGALTYGLLTRFAVQTLTQTHDLSRLSYDRWRQMIAATYHGSAGILEAPLPQLEGSPASLREAVLGSAAGPELPPYIAVAPLPEDARRARLAAGSLGGVTVGSVYTVVAADREPPLEPPATSADDELNVKIETVDGYSAIGRLFRGEEGSAARWPRELKQAAARERYHESGDVALRLAVVRRASADRDLQRLTRRDAGPTVAEAVDGARRPDEAAWLVWTEDDSPADVLLRIDGQRAALFPAVGGGEARGNAGGKTSDPLFGGWGPIDLETEPKKLGGYLRRFARARNLVRLATEASRQGSDGRTGSVGEPVAAPEMELVRVHADAAGKLMVDGAWPADPGGGTIMHPGDQYAVRLRHAADAAATVYATVLIIGPDRDIQIAFPAQTGVGLEDEQRLRPGEERLSDGFQCDDSAGERWAILLATAEPNDLTYVAQDALPKTRAVRGELDALLLEQTAFRSRSAAPVRTVAPVWSATTLRWESRPRD